MLKRMTLINVSILSFIGNILLLFVKGIIGVATGSNAMISDAIHSVGDSISSILSLIGSIASKNKSIKIDSKQENIEYWFSLIIGIVMMIISYKLIVSSFESIFFKKKYIISIWIIVICLMCIITKLILYFICKKVAADTNNLLIRALSIDHRNDIILTSLNLLSGIFAFYNIFLLDGLIGIVLSIVISSSAYKIIDGSCEELIDNILKIDN